jgi:hypothetical protein
LLCVCPEPGNLGGLVAVETDGDHRLQADTDDCGVDVGMETTEHSGTLETLDPLRTGRLGNTDSTGDFLVGQARILL